MTDVPPGPRVPRPPWIAKYARYFDDCQEECESLQEAINYLYWGEEAGVLRGLAIVDPEGNGVTVTWDEPVADA